ncbi:DUF922 domain-containing protein [Ciceribacter sp. L1K23]|uniref:DUF922 domain-containing Zn-dependent protease n=1 Tax=Ciceribacter sp. L1K23 TaxID=2820276 RepID=UPI0032C2235B
MTRLRKLAKAAFSAGIMVGATVTSANAEWQAIDKVETYPVRGSTGAELYASIGENGPKLGIARTIAHTSFRLTWKRDYQTRGTDCVLASAVPTLVITTVLPKPAVPLSGPLQQSWQTFIDGVTAHERVHGDHIKAMVKEIEKATIGLAEPNDPQCRKIREKMQPVLGEISRAERQKQREFDQVEFANGGNVQRLILALVNGP